MANYFEKLIRPVLFRLDAEQAHELGIKALEKGFAKPGSLRPAEAARQKLVFGPIERFGLKFENPLGIAAGFDKNAKVANQLADLGFGFVEVGTVTYMPQSGNPKPRLFRLPNDRALINRLGFNNDGAEAVAKRLLETSRNCVVGVNIGRNKDVDNEQAIENYLQAMDKLHAVADYIAINVSSPNTPNLRDLQSAENLDSLIGHLQKRNQELGKKPLLLKIAPDLQNEEIEEIVDICIAQGVSGIIATNTTISRTGLKTADPERFGMGGLSGAPLASRSNEVISTIYRRSNGKLYIIGVGGVFNAENAFEKIAAGAALVQAYTGFVYSGPSFARKLVSGLADVLARRGFNSLDEAVGSAVRVV